MTIPIFLPPQTYFLVLSRWWERPPAVTLTADRADYYAIQVEPGDSVRVALDGHAASGSNELYVTFEAIPTRLDYDHRSTSGGQDQESAPEEYGEVGVDRRIRGQPRLAPPLVLTDVKLWIDGETIHQDVGGSVLGDPDVPHPVAWWPATTHSEDGCQCSCVRIGIALWR